MARRPDPTTLGRFQDLTELGRGGMGVVYHARDPQLGREVAIKLALTSGEPQRLARFEREGQLTAGLQHPGIVGVHATGVHEGRPYLVYELVAGGRTLAEAMPELARPERLRLVHQVAEALGYAHAQGVIHRDVKPENVLVDAAGQARVVDFGLATACDLERLTQSGALVGTPSFMAPEQLTGDAQGPPTDVWALGVMLYEALADELPFQGENLLQLAAVIQSHDPPPPSQDAALNRICATALTRAPQRRYPDAQAFADDLGRYLRGEPLAGAPRRATLALAALLAVALGAAAAWSRPAPAPSPAPPPAASARAGDDPGELPPAEPYAGLEQEPQLLRHTRGGWVHADWLAPDRVLTWDDRGQLAVWDPTRNRPLRRWEVPGLRGVAVAPNGVVAGHGDGWFGRLPVRDDDPPFAPTRTGVTDGLGAFAIDPRGERVYLAGPRGSVTEFDLTSGDPQRSFESLDLRPVTTLALAPDGTRLVACGTIVEEVAALADAEGPLRFYDLTRDSPLGRDIISPSAVRQAAFQHDSSALALGLLSGYVVLLSRDGELVARFEPPDDEQPERLRYLRRAHQHTVRGVAFHPDGERLFTSANLVERSGPHGLELRVWDLRTGACLRYLTRERLHPPSYRMAISPDGARLLLENGDGAVRVWTID